MNSGAIYKLFKYLTCGSIIFGALKYNNINNMKSVDIAIIAIIASLIFAIVDNGSNLFGASKSTSDEKTCKSFCDMKEHMSSIAGIETNNLSSETNNMVKTTNMNYSPANTNSNIMVKEEQHKQHKQHVQEEQHKQHVQEESHKQHVQEESHKQHVQEEQHKVSFVLPDEESQASDYDRFQKRFSEIIDERQQHDPNLVTRGSNITRNDDASYTVPIKRRSPDIASSGSRGDDGPMKKSEMEYNVISYHTVPPNYNTGNFEYGYSFLPPKDWYPTPPFPPMCVTDKQCPVCPSLTMGGSGAELKEWDSSRRVTPADEINVRYVKEKLNSGK
jgi:hypothetical protein